MDQEVERLTDLAAPLQSGMAIVHVLAVPGGHGDRGVRGRDRADNARVPVERIGCIDIQIRRADDPLGGEQPNESMLATGTSVRSFPELVRP